VKSLPFNFVFNFRKEKSPAKSGELWSMGMGKELISVIHLCDIGLHTISALHVCVCVRACACMLPGSLTDHMLGLILF